MSRAPATGLTRRRAARLLATAGLLAWTTEALAAAKSLPASRSLSTELAQALAARQPLVVMVSLHGCPWCKLVRESYLAPMHAEEGLPVVQVDIGSAQRTESVDGLPTTHDALVRAWGVKLAPTLLFLGAGGREVAPRLVGGSPDFYSAYLDQRLAQARAAVVGKGT